MGNSASTSCLCLRDDDVVNSSQESSLIDPSLVVSSYCSNRSSKGQLHLLWKKGKPPVVERFSDRHVHLPTRLVIRKVKCEHNNNNSAAAIETHMYAVRKMEEQRPREPELRETEQEEAVDYKSLSPQELFLPQAMAPAPTLTSKSLLCHVRLYIHSYIHTGWVSTSYLLTHSLYIYMFVYDSSRLGHCQ